MRRLFIALLFVFALAAGAQGQANPPLKIREVDGSPAKTNATNLVFPNGTLSVSGSTVTYTPAGGATGTVLTIGVTTSAGVSAVSDGNAANPKLTFTLGDIAPSGVTIGAGSKITSSGAGGALGSRAFDSTNYLPLAGGTLTGGLLFTDNTLDIGASGATRPRTGYFGTSIISPLVNGLTITNNGTNTLNIAAGQTLTVTTGGTLGSAAYTSSAAYEVPLTFSTGLTRTVNTVTVNSSQNIATLSNLGTNGFVKTGGGVGTLSVDTNTYLTGNQTVTLTGDVTGSGATAITTVLANIPTATPAVGSIVHTNIAAPSSPSAGKDTIYTDSTDLRLHDKNAAGVIGTTVVSSSAGANQFATGVSIAGVVTYAQPTPTNVGLGSVTNDAQTKAAIVPNTAPSAGQILAGNAGGTAYAPVSLSGSGATFSLASTGVLTVSAIANASLSSSAITINGAAVALGATRTLLLASADFVNQGTTITVLHGNAAGNPSFAVVTPADAAGNTSGSGNFALVTSPTFVTPILGVASATSLATSAASPLLLTNGQLVTIALASQTVGGTTLTIPDFASVVDEFTFKTKAQTMSNKTFVAPALGTPVSGVLTNATGLPEGGLSLTDITTANSATTQHGFLKKLSNTATQYMDGTGNWSTPAGTGANTALSNLAAVAINTDLLPASTQGLGNASFPFLASFTGNTTQYESVVQTAGLITHATLGSATNIGTALTLKGSGGFTLNVGSTAGNSMIISSASTTAQVFYSTAGGVSALSGARDDVSSAVFGSTTNHNVRFQVANAYKAALTTGGNFALISTYGVGWNSSTTDPTASPDLFLLRAAAANLQLGAAAAASPVAQTLSTQGSRSGTDTNVAGGNFTIQPGNGTGNSTGSSLIFNTPVAVASGTGAQTQTATLTLQGGNATFGGTITNNLSIFAATTSAQLAGVLSDETGTGVAVFATTPTFTTSIKTPAITPTADSTTAFRLFKADGSTAVITADTTNILVGINTTPTYAIDLLKTGGDATNNYAALRIKTSANGGTNFGPTLILDGTSMTNGHNWNIVSTGTSDNNATGKLLFYDITAAAARLVVDTSGNLLIASAGGGLQIQSGTNQRAGNLTLVGGTKTVANTTVSANTIVILTRKTSGGTIGTAITYTVSAGTSFTVNSDNILDTSTFSFVLMEVL